MGGSEWTHICYCWQCMDKMTQNHFCAGWLLAESKVAIFFGSIRVNTTEYISETGVLFFQKLTNQEN